MAGVARPMAVLLIGFLNGVAWPAEALGIFSLDGPAGRQRSGKQEVFRDGWASEGLAGV